MHSHSPHSQSPHSQGPHSQGPHSQGPHSHSPNDLQGPIRGTPGWWQETGKSDSNGAGGENTQATLSARKKRGKKTGHRNYARAPGAPAAGATIRADLVERVRKEIEDGVYETTEKWEAALDRLLENL